MTTRVGTAHDPVRCADDLRVAVVASLADVDAARWDELASPAGFYMSRSWLRNMETHPDSDTSYVIVEEPCGRLAAAVPVHLVRFDDNPRYDTRLRGGHHPEYLLGSRRGYRSAVLVHPDVEPATGTAAVTLLARQVRALVGSTPTRVWYVPDVDLPTARDLARAVTGRAPRVESLGAEAVVPVRPGGFDDLVADQQTQRRTKLRRERARFLACGYQVGLESLAAVVDEAGPLLGQLERKYGTDLPAEEWIAYYRRLTLDEQPGEVLTCRETGGRLVGLVHFYQFGDALWARSCGFDYPRLHDAFEYFNLAFFELVELACRRGLDRVHLGLGSIDAKVRHGAEAGNVNLVTFDAGSPRGSDET